MGLLIRNFQNEIIIIIDFVRNSKLTILMEIKKEAHWSKMINGLLSTKAAYIIIHAVLGLTLNDVTLAESKFNNESQYFTSNKYLSNVV